MTLYDLNNISDLIFHYMTLQDLQRQNLTLYDLFKYSKSYIPLNDLL